MEVYHMNRSLPTGGVSQEEFKKLPYLWPRKLFQQITGLNHEDLREAVRTGQIERFYPQGKGKGYARYYKRDAAKLAGFKM